MKALIIDTGLNAGTLMPQTMPIKRLSYPFATSPPPSLQENEVFVPIFEEEYNELSELWNGALICKVLVGLFCMTFLQDFLQKEVKKIRKWEGRMKIISLGGVFTVKCSSESQKLSILTERPWFVLNHLAVVQQWTSGFQPSNANINHYPVWIHLPELPMQFHSKSVLEKIENNLE